MRIMISQGMNGRDEEDILKERNDITEKLNRLHIDVVDTYFYEEVEEDEYYNPRLHYLAKSIDMMGKVDAVFFARHWQKYSGCKIERRICEEYGIKILDDNFLNSWENVLTREAFGLGG